MHVKANFATVPGPYRFTRDQYYRMSELGFFEGSRSFMIAGPRSL